MRATTKNDTRVATTAEPAPPRPVKSAAEDEMAAFESEVQEMKRWFAKPRFKEITRLYSPSQVVQQRGTIENDYPIARKASEEFYNRLQELFSSASQSPPLAPIRRGRR